MPRSLFVVIAAIGSAGPAASGDLRTETVRSRVLGRDLEMNVLLPDGYDPKGDRRHPVVYLLHGFGGDYGEWARVGIVEEAKGLPVIIAMPEGDRSFYINHHGDPKARWEDYIVEDVRGYVENRYLTRPVREGRAISGLSMGGYGAVVLGLRHPDLFASVASHSGALRIGGGEIRGEIGERIRAIFGPEGSETRRAYDPVRLARGLSEEKRPHIYLDCGAQDFLLDANRAFVAELARLRVPYEYRETPGAHNFAYWKRNVRYSLTRQLEALARAREAAAAANDRPVTGTWASRVELPDGRIFLSTILLREDGGKLSGRVEWEGGEGTFTRLERRKDRLVLEIPIGDDPAARGIVRVTGWRRGDRLVGDWSLRGRDGTIRADVHGNPARGAWEAELGGKAAAEALPIPAAEALLGEWKLMAEFSGYKLDYTLRIGGTAEKLEAVLVSPRSGEHPFRAVAFEGGVLRMEIDRRLRGNAVTFVYEGRLTEKGLSGKVVPRGYEQYAGTWTAEKAR